jgi:hypothetical protein
MQSSRHSRAEKRRPEKRSAEFCDLPEQNDPSKRRKVARSIERRQNGLRDLLKASALMLALTLSAAALADPQQPPAVEAARDAMPMKTSLLLLSLGSHIETELQQQANLPLTFAAERMQRWQLQAEGAHFQVSGELQLAEQMPRKIEVQGVISRDDLALGALQVSDSAAATLLGVPSAAPRSSPAVIENFDGQWTHQQQAGTRSDTHGLAETNTRPWP